MKRCWKCAEEIQDAALACRFCQAKQGKPAPPPPSMKSIKRGAIIAGGMAGIIVIALIFDPKARSVAPTPPVPSPPTSAAADPYGGCILRGLGNQNLNLAHLVKQKLRNPPSFEHVRTEVGPVQGGTFSATMTYRATNGFGAVDTSVAVGEVRVSDCAARILTLG